MDNLTIDGFNYSASNVSGDEWMVRRWTTDPNDYVEALITVGSSATEEVVKAAIERNSWA